MLAKLIWAGINKHNTRLTLNVHSASGDHSQATAEQLWGARRGRQKGHSLLYIRCLASEEADA